MISRPDPASEPRGDGGRPWTPPGHDEKAGQQARPNDVRPERPAAPGPPPPTSEGKKD